jgi:hypothetical protein
MDKLFVISLQNTLEKSIVLLDNISTASYTDNTNGPFYTSIGAHIRHILDFYKSIFKGLSKSSIDLTLRDRDLSIENNIDTALTEIKKTLLILQNFSNYNLEKSIVLKDDLGSGKISIQTNLYSVLLQANSHTIHHYAIISQLLYVLNIEITDITFGYNSTTKIKVSNIIR